jgi:hypothetical protein
MTYIVSFIKTGSGVQKLLRDTHTYIHTPHTRIITSVLINGGVTNRKYEYSNVLSIGFAFPVCGYQ